MDLGVILTGNSTSNSTAFSAIALQSLSNKNISDRTIYLDGVPHKVSFRNTGLKNNEFYLRSESSAGTYEFNINERGRLTETLKASNVPGTNQTLLSPATDKDNPPSVAALIRALS